MTPSPDISRQLLDHLRNAGAQDVEIVCDGLPVIFSQSDTGVVLYSGTAVDCNEYGIDKVLGQFINVIAPSEIILCINPEDNCWWILRHLDGQSRSELIPVLSRILDIRDEFRRWLANDE